MTRDIIPRKKPQRGVQKKAYLPPKMNARLTLKLKADNLTFTAWLKNCIAQYLDK